MGETCEGNGRIGADLWHVEVYRNDQCVTPDVTPYGVQNDQAIHNADTCYTKKKVQQQSLIMFFFFSFLYMHICPFFLIINSYIMLVTTAWAVDVHAHV